MTTWTSTVTCPGCHTCWLYRFASKCSGMVLCLLKAPGLPCYSQSPLCHTEHVLIKHTPTRVWTTCQEVNTTVIHAYEWPDAQVSTLSSCVPVAELPKFVCLCLEACQPLKGPSGLVLALIPTPLLVQLSVLPAFHFHAVGRDRKARLTRTVMMHGIIPEEATPLPS